MTTIRPPTPHHIPRHQNIKPENPEIEKQTHAVLATQGHRQAPLIGDPPAAEALVAESSNTPAGFALFFHNYSTFAGQRGLYLEDLYVSPAFRNHGVGKALLTRLSQIAQERHCARFEWTVLDWNENAIHFYQKIGAAILPDWRICRMKSPEIKSLATGTHHKLR
jgi:GNAT superfamily N-acetyltransferase